MLSIGGERLRSTVVPQSVTVRRGAGAGGSDRVTLVFADNAIRNTWLRVTLLAGAATGLAAPDVFAFGNLPGDTGDGSTSFRVNALDLASVKRALEHRLHPRRPLRLQP